MCQSCRSSAATTICRSASALSAANPALVSDGTAAPAVFLNFGGHVLRSKHIAVGRDDHSLHHVSQLPHVVAAPVVGHQQIQGISRHFLRSHPESLTDSGHEEPNQLGDVGEPFPQRGYVQHVYAETEVEILSEPARCDLRLEITIRCRHDPGVHR